MSQKVIGRWMYGICLGLVALIPLVFYPAFSQFSLPKLAVLAVGVFVALSAWGFRYLSGGRQAIRSGPLALPVSMFLLAAFIAAAFSLDPTLSFLGKYRNPEGLVTLFAYGGLFLVASQIEWTRRRLINLARVIGVSGLLVSLYGLTQLAGLDPIEWGTTPFDVSRIFSTFGNPSLLGGYLSTVLLVSLGLSLTSARPPERVLWSINSALIAVALVFTLTRGAWIGAAVGVVVLLLVIKRVKGRLPLSGVSIYRPLGEFIAAFLVIVALVGLIPTASDENAGAAGVISRAEPGSLVSVADRFEMWTTAAGMIVNRPLLGQGLDTYRLRYEKFQTLEGAQIKGAGAVGEDAHNYFLQISATGGLITLSAALFLGVMLIVHGARSITSREENKVQGSSSMIMGSLLAGVAAYSVAALFTINVVGGAVLFWLVAGIVSSRISFAKAERQGTTVTGKAATVLGIVAVWLTSLGSLVIVLLLVAGDLTYQKAKDDWESALQSGSVIEVQKSADIYERAFRLNPWIDRYMADLSQNYLDLAHNTHENRFIPAANRANRKGAAARPLDPWYLVNQGLVDGRNALNLRSSRDDDRFTLAELALMKSAEQNFRAAIKLGPHSAYAHYFYGFLLIDLARWDEAVEQLTIAAESDPRLPDVMGAIEFAGDKADENAVK